MSQAAPAPDFTQPVPTEEVLVASDGSGQFRTIWDAVKGARGVSLIRVRPGVYRERLEIARPVEIVGDGPAGSIIVETDGSECMLVYAPTATFRNISFRCRSSAKNVEAYCLDIESRVNFEDCDITSQRA